MNFLDFKKISLKPRRIGIGNARFSLWLDKALALELVPHPVKPNVVDAEGRLSARDWGCIEILAQISSS
jgi:hypothetical protein